MSENEQVALYDVRDGVAGRSTQISTRDQELLVEAEITRARLEGREPVLTGNLPPAIGTVLVRKEDRTDSDNYRGASADGLPGSDPKVYVDAPGGPKEPDVDLSYAAMVAAERLQRAELVDEAEGKGLLSSDTPVHDENDDEV